MKEKDGEDSWDIVNGKVKKVKKTIGPIVENAIEEIIEVAEVEEVEEEKPEVKIVKEEIVSINKKIAKKKRKVKKDRWN